eukprot:351251-Chlamydomonas_euryale.AAC.6
MSPFMPSVLISTLYPTSAQHARSASTEASCRRLPETPALRRSGHRDATPPYSMRRGGRAASGPPRVELKQRHAWPPRRLRPGCPVACGGGVRGGWTELGGISGRLVAPRAHA